MWYFGGRKFSFSFLRKLELIKNVFHDIIMDPKLIQGGILGHPWHKHHNRILIIQQTKSSITGWHENLPTKRTMHIFEYICSDCYIYIKYLYIASMLL